MNAKKEFIEHVGKKDILCWEHHRCPVIPEHLNRLDKVREEKLNEIVK